MVPVIRGADQMNFADIEKTINSLAKKANEGTISIDEMAGGSFTVSNGGVYGSLISTPIINPPQVRFDPLTVLETEQRNGSFVPFTNLKLSFCSLLYLECIQSCNVQWLWEEAWYRGQ